MNPELLALAALVGAANWAFRYFPTRLDASALLQSGPWARFLAATGPAAIATLAVASLLPMVTASRADLVPLGAGVGAVLAAYLWRRSVVAATLAGSAAYGLAFALV